MAGRWVWVWSYGVVLFDTSYMQGYGGLKPRALTVEMNDEHLKKYNLFHLTVITIVPHPV